MNLMDTTNMEDNSRVVEDLDDNARPCEEEFASIALSDTLPRVVRANQGGGIRLNRDELELMVKAKVCLVKSLINLFI